MQFGSMNLVMDAKTPAAPAANSNIKTFKKNDVIFREGDKCMNLWLIQSGHVSLTMHRKGDKSSQVNIDFAQNLGAGQLIGELALAGSPTYPYTAVATAETKALELPLEALKTQIEAFPQLAKIMNKSLIERLKLFTTDLKSMRLDRDQTPCPADQTARIFGSVCSTVMLKGEKKIEKMGDVWVIPWITIRNYTQRVFGITPKRTENVMNLLVKIGEAKYTTGKSEEEGAEEIQSVTLFKLQNLDAFADFYQHWYFKGGKTELLKYDDRVFHIVSGILKCAEGQTPDRTGIVRVDWMKAVETIKADSGIQLNGDHFTLFETKGVYIKRHSTEKSGVELQFELAEMRKMVSFWGFMREIDKWNEKGSIDPNEPIFVKKTESEGPSCPACHKPYTGTPKFCAECGHKLAAAA